MLFALKSQDGTTGLSKHAAFPFVQREPMPAPILRQKHWIGSLASGEPSEP